MLATLIVFCPLISLGRGLCFAHTYSCEGGTSLLHRTAYEHKNGVKAKQTLKRVSKENPTRSHAHPHPLPREKVCKSCAFQLPYVSHQFTADSS